MTLRFSEGSKILRRDLALPVALQPTVLVVDDLDELSPDAVDGMTSLLRQQVAIEGSPILLVGSIRGVEGPMAPLLNGTATGLTPDVLPLSGLHRTAVISLVRDLGVAGAFGAALGRLKWM